MGPSAKRKTRESLRSVLGELTPRDRALRGQIQELERELADERARAAETELHLDEVRRESDRLRRQTDALWSAYSDVSIRLQRTLEELELPAWRRLLRRPSRRGRAADVRSTGWREGPAGSIVQSIGLAVGLGLIAGGALGFFVEASEFSAGSNVQGENVYLFEVNGWHNVLHVSTGAVLLLLALWPGIATTGALMVGLAYAGMAAWGFINGDNVANVIPTNTADNWLHAGIAATLVLAASASARRERSWSRTEADPIAPIIEPHPHRST